MDLVYCMFNFTASYSCCHNLPVFLKYPEKNKDFKMMMHIYIHTHAYMDPYTQLYFTDIKGSANMIYRGERIWKGGLSNI